MKALLWPDGQITDISEGTPPREGAELIEVVSVEGEQPYKYDRETKKVMTDEIKKASQDKQRELREVALENLIKKELAEMRKLASEEVQKEIDKII